jgi:hypothetical protein
MQRLNDASLRHTHPVLLPNLKAMTVPKNSYKTMTDAWEGYHSVPLDKESSKLTSFVTPFGCYRYLTNPHGNHVSGDAYNKRFDMVNANVKDVQRQVDDSLLWKPTVAECFADTAEYLTLLGNNGILQNSTKFQFCKQEVDWSCPTSASPSGTSPHPSTGPTCALSWPWHGRSAILKVCGSGVFVSSRESQLPSATLKNSRSFDRPLLPYSHLSTNL